MVSTLAYARLRVLQLLATCVHIKYKLHFCLVRPWKPFPGGGRSLNLPRINPCRRKCFNKMGIKSLSSHYFMTYRMLFLIFNAKRYWLLCQRFDFECVAWSADLRPQTTVWVLPRMWRGGLMKRSHCWKMKQWNKEMREQYQTWGWHSSKVENSRQRWPITLAWGCTAILRLHLLLFLPSLSLWSCVIALTSVFQPIWCLEVRYSGLVLSHMGSNYRTVFRESTLKHFVVLFIYYP